MREMRGDKFTIMSFCYNNNLSEFIKSISNNYFQFSVEVRSWKMLFVISPHTWNYWIPLVLLWFLGSTSVTYSLTPIITVCTLNRSHYNLLGINCLPSLHWSTKSWLSCLMYTFWIIYFVKLHASLMAHTWILIKLLPIWKNLIKMLQHALFIPTHNCSHLHILFWCQLNCLEICWSYQCQGITTLQMWFGFSTTSLCLPCPYFMPSYVHFMLQVLLKFTQIYAVTLSLIGSLPQ